MAQKPAAETATDSAPKWAANLRDAELACDQTEEALAAAIKAKSAALEALAFAQAAANEATRQMVRAAYAEAGVQPRRLGA